MSLHLATLKSINKYTGYLVHIVFRLIINWVALWEPMSSFVIHNITGFLLGLYQIFRTPYNVVQLINLICFRNWLSMWYHQTPNNELSKLSLFSSSANMELYKPTYISYLSGHNNSYTTNNI